MATTRPEDAREHQAGMAVHAFMMAADDVRQLLDDEIAENEADLRLTVSVLLARLRRAKRPSDTS